MAAAIAVLTFPANVQEFRVSRSRSSSSYREDLSPELSLRVSCTCYYLRTYGELRREGSYVA
ncbi:hypothetical protein RUM43_010243 [Polyplax serrata]|uniref:Uncharacterized protein n=1 Tax=Polyplax serrata TaxID=468196 RepID=A0AAN8S751_POLSC